MSRARDFADLAASADAGGLTGRNLIINGAMQCWQRATAATAANNSFTTVDRFRPDESTDGAYTTEQSTDTPTGSGFSLKAQVTTADTSIAATQFALIQQTIEAQNCQSLEYGTSTAKALSQGSPALATVASHPWMLDALSSMHLFCQDLPMLSEVVGSGQK